MLKVFLVEDESILREGFRDFIPWQQYGYEYVGEASDGEMALPLIRKVVPDVLITDIKMPFMDGLELSELVTKEFPDMKVVIISGYDEFELARRAIKVGVEQYLLKPITKSALIKVLVEIREKIESEQAQKDYAKRFETESREYEQLTRRNFFEKVFGGQLSVQEIYEETKKYSLDIDAPCYNIILFEIQDVFEENNRYIGAELIENIRLSFMKYSEYLVFRWNVNIFGVLIMGEKNEIDELSAKGVSIIENAITQAQGIDIDWHIAVGTPVERLSLLSDCYKGVNHIFAHRYINPEDRVLDAAKLAEYEHNDSSEGYDTLDVASVDPKILEGFLSKGQTDEVDEFVDSYIANLQEPLKSKLFRDYLVLAIRFAVISYVQSMGKSQEEFLDAMDEMNESEISNNTQEMQSYFKKMITEALKTRDEQSATQSRHILKNALQYIEENYSNENLSLNEVASVVFVSPNYFSAVFSAQMEKTFVEYVTEKRMEKAKKLLRGSDKHLSDIAYEVGYKDSHYFSFVFKKTQGVTPREYRNGAN